MSFLLHVNLLKTICMLKLDWDDRAVWSYSCASLRDICDVNKTVHITPLRINLINLGRYKLWQIS